MRICKMNYLRRLNLGNYEHKEFSAEAVLDEIECSTTAAAALRAFVDGELTGKPAVEEKKAAPVVEKKAAPVVEKKAAPVVEKKEEPVVEKAEAPVVEEKAAPVVEKKKKAPVGADIPYDRTNDSHRKAFQDYLFATFGTDVETKKKGGNFSRSYEGKPLLTSAGVLCDAFKEAIAKAME